MKDFTFSHSSKSHYLGNWNRNLNENLPNVTASTNKFSKIHNIENTIFIWIYNFRTYFFYVEIKEICSTKNDHKGTNFMFAFFIACFITHIFT